MELNSEIEKYGIIVIQSLKESERKTGDELQHDLLQYKQYTRDDMFSEIKYVVTKDDFFKTMDGIAELALSNNYLFSLHFETHGDIGGVYLASGECITWEEFYNSLIPINEALYNNLLVVMAMCKGGAIVSYLDVNKRAPYRAFIGAFRNLSPDEIAKGFAAFYADYYNMLDTFKCLDSMNQELGAEPKTFWLMAQEEVFNAVLDPYRDRKAFVDIVSKNTKKYRKLHKLSQREMIRIATKQMLDDRKNKKDYFCFKDIYSDKGKDCEN